MNPERKSYSDKPRLFEREEKLKASQIYKSKNRQHPALKNRRGVGK